LSWQPMTGIFSKLPALIVCKWDGRA